MIITITMIMNQSLSGMIEGDTSKMGQHEPLVVTWLAGRIPI